MGFSGGGSNILKPHTHDGSIAQDGGALNMDGITQGSLTAGDVVYSDGSNLQRLAIGNASDQMRVNAGATAPEWFTPAGAAGWTELANVVLTSSGTLESGTFAAMDSLYCQIYAAQAGTSSNQTVKFNGDNSAIYNWRSQANNGAQSTRTAVTNGIIYLYDTPNSTLFCSSSNVYLQMMQITKKLVVINTTESNGNRKHRNQIK